MNSSLFSEAIEYFGIEPFGSERDNIHAGIIASTIANVHISDKNKMLTPSTFMLKDSVQIELEQADKERKKINELMGFMRGINTNEQ